VGFYRSTHEVSIFGGVLRRHAVPPCPVGRSTFERLPGSMVNEAGPCDRLSVGFDVLILSVANFHAQ
jgi:hypothetical protein